MRAAILAGLVAASSGGGAVAPTRVFVKQSVRYTDVSGAVPRVLHRCSARTSVILRNTGATIVQYGFTTAGNNNNNAPVSWSDLAVGDEYYEGDVDHQIWIRQKTALETISVQLEVDTPRI